MRDPEKRLRFQKLTKKTIKIDKFIQQFFAIVRCKTINIFFKNVENFYQHQQNYAKNGKQRNLNKTLTPR